MGYAAAVKYPNLFHALNSIKMAKQHSFVKLSGKVGDITFMQTRHGFQARQASGIDGRRIKNDPSFERTRWAMAEFTHIVQCATLLYTAIQYTTNQVKDSDFRIRLNSTLHKLKMLDTTNPTGKRLVSEGLKSPDALKIAKQINVNSKFPIQNVVPKERYEIDYNTGEIRFDKLNTEEGILKSIDCYKLGFSAIWVNIDFEKLEYSTKFTPQVMADVNNLPQDITLALSELPSGNGMTFIFLKVQNYYRNTDDTDFPGKDLGYNSFGLIDAFMP